MIFKRAVPPGVPNAVTGDACPPVLARPKRVKLTVRLPPLDDAFLDQLEDRLEEYVRTETKYQPDPLVTRSIRLKAETYEVLKREAAAAGTTVNNFILHLLRDRKLDPSAAVTPPPTFHSLQPSNTSNTFTWTSTISGNT